VLEASTADRPLDTPASLIARIERVPFSRWHIRARLIVGSATFFDAFDALSLAFVLPVLVKLWHISPAQVGQLISVGYIGQFVGALVFGALAERMGRIRSASLAVVVMSAMSLACAATGSFEALLVCRLIQGIGVGGEMPVAATYISELSRAQGRGRFFMLYEMIFPIGLMMTGQIGAVLVPALGWQVMFIIGGIPGLVIALLLLRLPESPRWLIAKGRLDEAAAIVADMEASTSARVAAVEARPREPVPAPALLTTAHPESTGGASATPAARRGWTELLSPAYRSRTFVVWVLWVCAYFVTNGLNNWMPTLYNSVYKLDLQQSLRAGTLNNVAQVAVLIACAFLVDRIGRRHWMMAGFVLGGVLLGVLGSTGATSVTVVIALVTLSYGIVGSANAVLYLYTPEIYPTRMRAIGTGAATCWLRLASAAAPLIVGYLVERGGISGVFWLFAAVSLAGAVASTRMLETRNRRLEDTGG
jgi:putative MFS transporter